MKVFDEWPFAPEVSCLSAPLIPRDDGPTSPGLANLGQSLPGHREREIGLNVAMLWHKYYTPMTYNGSDENSRD